MSTNEKLRIAQVGVANFGGYRRERLRETGLFQFVTEYDINAEALAKAVKEDGAVAASSYEALIATPGVEAVIISTGAKFHAEQAIAAANRGLHVFIEKPLCATPQETRDLLAVQKKTGVVIGVGHGDHAHDAIAGTIKRYIDSGDLGTIATFEKTTAHSGGLQIKPGDWRGDPQKNPGGMLFQCGVHALHELMFYFGPVAEVSAMMRYDANPNTQTADVAICNLRFKSGLIGNLNAYHVTAYRHTFNIFGTKANLYRDERFYDEGTHLAIQRDFLDNKKQPRERVEVTGTTDACGNLRSFYNAIRAGGGVEPYPSLKDGARAVAAVFAAEESAKTGRPVKVEEI
jgi:predicted dehydrogenase